MRCKGLCSLQFVIEVSILMGAQGFLYARNAHFCGAPFTLAVPVPLRPYRITPERLRSGTGTVKRLVKKTTSFLTARRA